MSFFDLVPWKDGHVIEIAFDTGHFDAVGFGPAPGSTSHTEVLTDLLGPDVLIQTSKLNTKAPGGGAAVEWHQDWAFYPHSNDDMLAVGLMLEDVDEANGPLMVVPGSHRVYVACVGATPADHYKASLKKQEYGVPDMQSLERLAANEGVEAMKGRAGSVILFDCNAMHGSNSNISPYPRCNLFMVYNSVENALGPPLFGLKPRPEFIAAREHVAPLEPVRTDYSAWR